MNIINLWLAPIQVATGVYMYNYYPKQAHLPLLHPCLYCSSTSSSRFFLLTSLLFSFIFILFPSSAFFLFPPSFLISSCPFLFLLSLPLALFLCSFFLVRPSFFLISPSSSSYSFLPLPRPLPSPLPLFPLLPSFFFLFPSYSFLHPSYITYELTRCIYISLTITLLQFKHCECLKEMMS